MMKPLAASLIHMIIRMNMEMAVIRQKAPITKTNSRNSGDFMIRRGIILILCLVLCRCIAYSMAVDKIASTAIGRMALRANATPMSSAGLDIGLVEGCLECK